MYTKGDGSAGTSEDLLAHRLRKARQARGWSIRNLERRSGVSNSAIALIEKGKRRQPRTDTIRRLAEALGLSPAYLAGFQDEPVEMPPATTKSQSLTQALRISESHADLGDRIQAAPPEVQDHVRLFFEFTLQDYKLRRWRYRRGPSMDS